MRGQLERSTRNEIPAKLRASQTSAERHLWLRLRNRQIDGVKFRRQCPVGPYVVDFLSYEAKLIVEVDGSQHLEDANVEQDEARTRYFETLGLRVIRFDNRQVLQETDLVLEAIFRELRGTPSP